MSDRTIKGSIDGRPIAVRPDTVILEAARSLGLAIPTLCHHPGLPEEGGCRLCLVEIAFGSGPGRLVAACMYPLRDNDFVISTASEAVRAARRFVLEMLLSRCPASPRLQALAAEYGVEAEPRFVNEVEAGPERTLPNQKLCILCGRCVRACEAKGPPADGLGGGPAISLVGRGRDRQVAGPFYRSPEDCLGCLACASVCPTGAILAEEKGAVRRIWGREFKLRECPVCGRAFAAAEQLRYLRVEEESCPDCRRRETAADLKALLP